MDSFRSVRPNVGVRKLHKLIGRNYKNKDDPNAKIMLISIRRRNAGALEIGKSV